MNNFVLESENFSSSLDANKTADLTFKGQIGGPNDTSVGLFCSGSYARVTGESHADRLTNGVLYRADADYPATIPDGVKMFP